MNSKYGWIINSYLHINEPQSKVSLRYEPFIVSINVKHDSHWVELSKVPTHGSSTHDPLDGVKGGFHGHYQYVLGLHNNTNNHTDTSSSMMTDGTGINSFVRGTGSSTSTFQRSWV